MIESEESRCDPLLADLQIGVVIPAAGSGQRMGTKYKQFMHLAGRPVLEHVLNMFEDQSWVKEVVVALPQPQLQEPPVWFSEYKKVRRVPGGSTRRDSVWNGIKDLSQGLDLVVVHDGARPLTPQRTFADCIKVASKGVGAVSGVKVVDTLKVSNDEQEVLETLERKGVWRAQTPQVFPYDVIFSAYHKAIKNDWDASDDSVIIEKAGGHVKMVESSPLNFKITVAADMDMAEFVFTHQRS